MIKELKQILSENNISHTNKFELLVYDPPINPLIEEMKFLLELNKNLFRAN